MRTPPGSGARCLAALLAVLWVGAAAPLGFSWRTLFVKVIGKRELS